jgi:hypothetical protein
MSNTACIHEEIFGKLLEGFKTTTLGSIGRNDLMRHQTACPYCHEAILNCLIATVVVPHLIEAIRPLIRGHEAEAVALAQHLGRK